MNYSKRLIEISKSVKKGSSLIDVGCDHGYIAKMLLDSGTIDKVIESDISEKSLEKAQLLLSGDKYKDKIKFIVSDGLVNIDSKGYDTLLIAGMGEETIVSILSKSLDKARCFSSIIIQAMGEGSNIRKYFKENDFFIKKERLFIEKEKYYRLYEVINKKTNVKDYTMPVNFNMQDIEYLKVYYENEIKSIEGILNRINKEKNLSRFEELSKDLNKIKKYMEKINEKEWNYKDNWKYLPKGV